MTVNNILQSLPSNYLKDLSYIIKEQRARKKTTEREKKSKNAQHFKNMYYIFFWKGEICDEKCSQMKWKIIFKFQKWPRLVSEKWINDAMRCVDDK